MNKNRALLLDRDGVINVDTAYVGQIERFTFMPDLFPFLRTVQDLGYRLAVLTNQAGVARGFYTESDYHLLTAHMLKSFRRERIDIDLTLACFEHPEGAQAVYARESFWRKPNAGMVLEATRRLDLNPARSAFLGDAWRDMQAAQAGNIGQCLWLTQKQETAPEGITLVRSYSDALKALSA